MLCIKQEQENKLLKLDSRLVAANKLLREQSLEVEECKTMIHQLENEMAGLCGTESKLGSSRDNRGVLKLSDLEK